MRAYQVSTSPLVFWSVFSSQLILMQSMANQLIFCFCSCFPSPRIRNSLTPSHLWPEYLEIWSPCATCAAVVTVRAYFRQWSWTTESQENDPQRPTATRSANLQVLRTPG